MRTKRFFIILFLVIGTSLLLIFLGPGSQQNDSTLKSIVTQTQMVFQENLVSDDKRLDINDKYMQLLGFTGPPIHNNSRFNFSLVTYVLVGQAPAAILMAQDFASKLPNESLLIYDLGLNEDEAKSLTAFCNSTKCSVIQYDLTQFPSYVANEERLHAYRPLIIKDALTRSRAILFTESGIRIRASATLELQEFINRQTQKSSGVMGWRTRQAVSTQTHPKMFQYFETDPENFKFLPMVSLNVVWFSDTPLINDKILLPWIKCVLTMECVRPIGAQSGGCRYNKKPLYRYSGCHEYDTSAFNIVLGIVWKFDETKYSIGGDMKFFYQESLEQSTKILENKRKNISDTSDHPFSDE